jgi:hypothetical protein
MVKNETAAQRYDAANRWPDAMTSSQHIYEVGPRKDHRGVDLISDALPIRSAVV